MSYNKNAENYLRRASWWDNKHIPINFIYKFFPLPVDSPSTVKFGLILRYQSFCLLNTIPSGFSLKTNTTHTNGNKLIQS